MVPPLLYSLVLTVGPGWAQEGVPFLLLPGDLRTGPGSSALGTIQSQAATDLPSQVGLLSTSLLTCGTTSHGPIWAIGLVWGFCAEAIHKRPLFYHGGSGYT